MGSCANRRCRGAVVTARGHVTHNGARAFTFNRANQLAASGNHAYLYDGMNRRVKTQDGLGTRYWMYDAGGRLLYRQTAAGEGTNYIYLGNRLIAREGALQQEGRPQHHTPYGSSIEPPRDDLGYAGHQFDTQLNLTYMQARYYDPAIGRFYSNDPVGYLTGNPHSFNRYAYANNNPYKYTDPDGELPIIPILIVAYKVYSAYDTAQSTVANVKTLADESASTGDKLRAGGELVGGLLAGKAGRKLGGKATEAADSGRSGKPFTRAGKREVIEQNQKANDGTTICQGCGKNTIPATQSKKGVSPSSDETRIDHIDPMSKGGAGDPSNGQVLCSACNLDKSNKTDWTPPKDRRLE